MAVSTKLQELSPVYLTGNLGLGDPSPGYRLCIQPNAAGNSTISLQHSNDGNGIRFRSTDSAGNKSGFYWINSGGVERWRILMDPNGNKTDDIRFISDANSKSVLILKPDGTVGVGKTPVATFDVNGEIYAQQPNGAIGTYLSYSGGNSTGVIGTRTNHGLEIRTNNSEKVRIDTSGNITVKSGTSHLWNSGNVSIISGNLGIGGTPNTVLNIRKSTPILRITGTLSDDNASVQLLEYADTPTYGFELIYVGKVKNRFYIRRYNASTTAKDVLAIARSNGHISICGHTDAFDTTGPENGLQLYYETDTGKATLGSYSSGSSTELTFHTNKTGSASTEKMRIDWDGNMLIKNTTGTRGGLSGYGILYVDSGKLMYRGPGGKLTQLAASS